MKKRAREREGGKERVAMKTGDVRKRCFRDSARNDRAPVWCAVDAPGVTHGRPETEKGGPVDTRPLRASRVRGVGSNPQRVLLPAAVLMGPCR